MIKIIKKEDCVGCNACVQRCPKQCISYHEDEQGFLYPKVDESLCIKCGLCEKVCPVINQAEPRKPIAVYAARNLDTEVQKNSSSGGVFFALAKSVIEQGGVVFGAKFNDKWEVVHDYAETLDGIRAFQGSKYVQSRIEDNFAKAERFLKDGRKVMFTGTPCQLAGLRLFLRKDYGEQLLKVDVVCHGVPSPLIWREYLKFITARPTGAPAGKNTDFISLNGIPASAGISFRDKKLGWEKYGFSVRTAATNGSGENSDFQSAIRQNPEGKFIFFETHDKNLFMQIFLRDLDLRPSCYDCPTKCGKAHSDITLADFWGVEKLLPQAYDSNGVSLILIHTLRGNMAVESLPIETYKTDYGAAIESNRSIEKSVSCPPQYNFFWKKFNKGGFESITTLTNIMHRSLIQRIISKLKIIIQRVIRL